MKPDRVLIGLILVTVGVLFLLDWAGTLDAGQVISDWWPAAIIALGLATLADRPVSLLGPLVLLVAGVLLLLFTLDILEGSAWNVIWPSALVVFGVVVLFRKGLRRGRGIPVGTTEDDAVRTTAFLSGAELVTQSKAFRGGVLTAILGGAELDMRSAKLAEEGADIDATAILGGVDVIVPHGWRVSVRGTPILGGVSNTTEDKELPDDAPVLRVDALAILGGIDIKHKK